VKDAADPELLEVVNRAQLRAIRGHPG
jgi:hypothetical protein